MTAQGREDAIIRTACGALVGLFVGLVLLVRLASNFTSSVVEFVLVVVGSVVVCAGLALWGSILPLV